VLPLILGFVWRALEKRKKQVEEIEDFVRGEEGYILS